MLIVPEQSSFDTEKTILDLFGAKDAAKIQIMTLTKLVELVSQKFGGNFRKKINKADRVLLMSLAIDEVADKLKIYSGQLGKMEFIEMMISALSEFKMCNVTNKSVLNVLPSIDDTILKEKIKETFLILEAYEALLKNTYVDPFDDLTVLTQKISQHRFFDNYTVFFDGFEGFTMQQLLVLEIIMKQCTNCFITLCSDKNEFLDDKISLFLPINRTAKKILSIAKKNGINVNEHIYLETSYKFKNNGLKVLESQIFRTKKQELLQKVDDVFVFSGNTKYDEVEFVCQKIKQLVYNNDYKYKDFAVVTRNDEVYKGVLDVAFEKYEIPYFMDNREEIITKPLMILIISVFEIINNNFSSQSIFKYLKTGLIDFEIEEISELENYILFWNITGKRWFKEFTANPDGYEKMNEDSKARLIKLNVLREKVVSPLLKLKQSICETTGDIISKSLYNFLCDINITDRLKEFCERLKITNQQNLAEEQVRLWDLLIEILEKMETILKDRRISSKKYLELLKLVMSSYDIAFIPNSMDEVIFGSIDRIRVNSKKVVFLIGAIEGEFPRAPVSSGVFTDSQRKSLILNGLPLYDSIEGLSINERFLAYKAVTLPSEKLFVTWHSSTTLGGVHTPSAIVREINFILKDFERLDNFSEDLTEKIWAIKPAFEVCARYWNDKSRFSQTLMHYFSQLGTYDNKLSILENVNLNLNFKIKNKQLAKTFFGSNMRISASQIEKFYLCKFAYFCQYGLRAKERKKAKFDALQYGNLIHFIFEKILKKFEPEQLLKFSKTKLLEEIQCTLRCYIKENLGGWTEKSKRIEYLYNRVVNAALPLIVHMARELSQSEFFPVGYEEVLSDKNIVNSIKLRLSNGTSVIVEGKVDRVDIMQLEDKNYVRVVDYKTGIKEFRLSDILYGLNLQMLIYLEALCVNSVDSFKKMVPAGILYFPAVSTVLNLNREESLEKLEKEKMKKLRMNGLILDDKKVILGMEPSGDGIYIPAALKDGQAKSCDALINVEQMSAIIRYTNDLIISMAELLQNGVIGAQPVKGDYDACEFCEYKTVCMSLRDEESRKIEKVKKDEFFDMLKSDVNGGEKNG